MCVFIKNIRFLNVLLAADAFCLCISSGRRAWSVGTLLTMLLLIALLPGMVLGSPATFKLDLTTAFGVQGSENKCFFFSKTVEIIGKVSPGQQLLLSHNKRSGFDCFVKKLCLPLFLIVYYYEGCFKRG